MVFVGIDHGTSGITTCILYNNGKKTFFKLKRTEIKSKSKSYIEELKKYVNIKEIKLMGVCYSMGDGINKITNINKVLNRGVLNLEGIGEKVGGGTIVFDEIKDSEIPAILIPGLHKNVDSMDERFNALYSHIASPEKISIAYNAFKTFNYSNFILSDISSNTVSLLIKDSKIFGGFDACVGASGILHGPLDLELIRDIDLGKINANSAFSKAGVVKIAKLYEGVEDTKKAIMEKYNSDENCKLALDSLVLSVCMEINSLMFLNPSNKVVLAGSIGSWKDEKENIDVSNMINEMLNNSKNSSESNKIDISVLYGESAAEGSALIAKDVYNGVKDVLGIKIDY
ncbi:methanogenesis marker 12 protein [Methanococcus voltae]|uniref:UPF0285 protein Mvol_0732 n=1 Tax=Methanococcus voltae (strain ATCC BAA-1334 / A3) TaxID=456320 RepID=D7DTD1_METV3|nr:methanogenesis marker 12 protein [Methanococcus voltae]MCS3901242.1 putative methanogenesis marker protein 12 [Methanococcus voltae]